MACLHDESKAEHVIMHIKSTFAKHGIPQILISCNGPPFNFFLFVDFARTYGFQHITSSPYFPRSDGEAERGVQTIKRWLKSNPDFYIALLSYRSTPLKNGFSPAELLMGRRLRTTLLMLPGKLNPKWGHLNEFRKADSVIKQKQKNDYDKRHGVKNFPPLLPETYVWIDDDRNLQEGQIDQRCEQPRSCNVAMARGSFRKNRRGMIPISLPSPQGSSEPYVTRYGRAVKCPQRYPN